MRIAVAILALLVALVPMAAQAATPNLGAGLAYFDKSQETAPVLFGSYDFTARKQVTASWAQDGETNHAQAGLELVVGEAPFELGRLYVAAGGGYQWGAWNSRRAELSWGGGLQSAVGIFETRIGFSRFTSGPSFDSSQAVYAAVYVLGKK